MLKGECGSVFKNVWSSPPAGLADDLVWVHCPATCGKCGEQPPAAAVAPVPGKCISWRQTKDCAANGKRQPSMDRGCDEVVKGGWSGYCECEGGIRTAESDCRHQPFTCEAKCGEQYAYLRQQRQAKVSAMGEVEAEAFDADDSLTKLYKRGKGFYVMGNTELALRHFREALKLDPEHKACKEDYKQAKTRKLALALALALTRTRARTLTRTRTRNRTRTRTRTLTRTLTLALTRTLTLTVTLTLTRRDARGARARVECDVAQPERGRAGHGAPRRQLLRSSRAGGAPRERLRHPSGDHRPGGGERVAHGPLLRRGGPSAEQRRALAWAITSKPQRHNSELCGFNLHI